MAFSFSGTLWGLSFLAACISQNLSSQQEVNKAFRNSQDVYLVDSIENKLVYIGEIKGKSYVRLTLNPVSTPQVYESESFNILRYKGSYYESVSGKKYAVTGDFDPESRLWIFRCFNKNNQPVFIFSGKQKPDGSIDGTWKSKRANRFFYLKPS